MSTPENPLAFPSQPLGQEGFPTNERDPGMTLRDWFAGQALANPAICTGIAKDYELDLWFGRGSTGIRREQIVARQAVSYADAMLAAREQSK